MGYPAEMRESIKILESTRPARLKQQILRMTFEQREELLHQFHPDYRPEGIAVVRVGPNQGQKMNKQFVEVLEARSRLDPDRFNLSEVDHDVEVLVVGGGGGGVTAALHAHQKGASVLLATKLRLGDSNTIMAEGGIAAATKPNDSPRFHFLDTLGGGRFENKRDLVRALVTDAPFIVEWLRELGAMFDLDENGMIVSFAGGHVRKRVHSCKDLSGMEFMRVIRDELRNRQIPVLEFCPAVELIKDDRGRCAGAVLQNLETGELLTVRARAVILATGGMGRLHPNQFPTTNHYGATADGLVIGYRAGVNLLHMDAVQYHPTGAAWPEQQLGQLLTEALRGNGAHLVNREGQRFVNELETRDTTSSAIIREVVERKKGIRTPTGMEGVWVDTPVIDIIGGKGRIEQLFAGILQRYREYGIDVRKEPMLVFPTQHYQNGGLEINDQAETCLPGLFAAGEVSGGVQGRNRLGGNSLLDIFVFGRRAGNRAADYVKSVELGSLTLEHVRKYHAELENEGIGRDRVSPILLPDYTRPEIRVRKYN